jgi:hypothetical protein
MTGLTGYQTVNDKEVGGPPWNRGWWSDWPWWRLDRQGQFRIPENQFIPEKILQ